MSGSSLSPSRLFWRLRDARPERLLHRWRLAVLVGRTRLHAEWHRARIQLDVAPGTQLGRDVRIVLLPHSDNVLRIAEGSSIGDRVVFRMSGGTIDLGPTTQLRDSVVLNVGGHLELVASNILSWGCIIHASESVRLEPLASAAEQVTIADSTHFFTEPDTFFYDNVRSAPIRIGGNTWLCPKVTITSGVTVGSHCIVASSSVVTDDVPDGHLAAGMPATSRPMKLPWDTDGG